MDSRCERLVFRLSDKMAMDTFRADSGSFRDI